MAEIPILTGRAELALEWIERAAARHSADDPREQQLRSVKAYALWALGRPEEALAELGDVRGMLPAFILLRAIIHVSLGRSEEARADIDALLEADPTYSHETHRRKYFYLDPEQVELTLLELANIGLPDV